VDQDLDCCAYGVPHPNRPGQAQAEPEAPGRLFGTGVGSGYRDLAAASRLDNAPSAWDRRSLRWACGGRTMPTRANPSPASDERVCALLERYECPVPFHEVRTRFLGNIASPVMSASPIKVVQDLWGGELPPFDTIDEANELIGALVMGLWNRMK
jgi:hypothetical protein